MGCVIGEHRRDFTFYWPPMKLQEGNVFIDVCHSVHAWGFVELVIVRGTGGTESFVAYLVESQSRFWLVLNILDYFN